MRKVISLILTLMLFSVFVFAGSAETHMHQFEGAGYDSPEDAICSYIRFMNNGDIDGMISAFAIETYIDNFNTLEYLKFTTSMARTMYMGITSNRTYSRNLLYSQRYGKIANTLFNQYLYYSCTGSEYNDLAEGGTIVFRSDAEVANYIEYIDSASVSCWNGKIKIEQFVEPYDYLPEIKRDSYLRDVQRSCNFIGCDEYRDVACILEICGDEYMLSMGCGRYAEQWYIIDFNGTCGPFLGFTSISGGLKPMSALHFD